MGRSGFGGGWLGSVVLLVAVAVLLLRPWEELGGGDGGAPGGSQTLHGLIVRAVDGDTVEVRLTDPPGLAGRSEDVRLIGVDTPETVKPDTPVQCFGPQASAFEHRVAEGRRARLLTGVEPRDVYGRLLAYVYLLAGGRRLSDNPKQATQRERFLNAELVRRGLARTLTIPPNDRFAERFAALQRGAAEGGRGLWGAC